MIDLGGFSISFSQRNVMVAVLIIYSAVILGLGFWVKAQSKKQASGGFSSFLTGGGNLNAFEVAMLTVTATLAGGTMVGSPGLCYSNGLSTMFEVLTGFCVTFGILGIAGKKTAIVGKRIGCTSPIQFMRHRYQSRALSYILCASLVTFGITQSSSNLMIAAKLFTAITGVKSYWYGLLIAVVAIVAYTLAGGIKSLAKVAVVQGVLMVVVVVALMVVQYRTASDMYGSIEGAIKSVEALTPELVNVHKLTPFYCLGLILFNSCIAFSLPTSIQSNLTYSSSKTLSRAVIIGVISTTLLHFAMTGGSLLTRAINPNLTTPDYSIVFLTTSLLPSAVAGLAICACFAAVQSTIAALLLIGAGSVVKDLIKTDIKPDMDDKAVGKLNIVVMIAIAAVAVLIGVKPSTFSQLLTYFSTGGMAATYLWPYFLGMFWKKATRAGALWSSAGGFICYAVCTLIANFRPEAWAKIGSPNSFVPAFALSVVLMIVVSLCTKKVPLGISQVWFSSDYDEEFTQKYDLR